MDVELYIYDLSQVSCGVALNFQYCTFKLTCLAGSCAYGTYQQSINKDGTA